MQAYAALVFPYETHSFWRFQEYPRPPAAYVLSAPGASVELSTGEKALVLRENKENVLCPTVVSFRDNSILDLALPQNEDIQIVDVMKTMDNRYILKK